MKRVFVSVSRKDALAIYEAHEDSETLARTVARSSHPAHGWTGYSEPVEFIAADEVERMIAEAVAAARRAA